MTRVEVVEAFGRTFQFTEKDGKLTIQEILPPPFLTHYDLPDVDARRVEMARNWREQHRAQVQP